MSSLRLMVRAELDLENAVAWYESRSPMAARRFEISVVATLDRIARLPEMYALMDGLHRVCPIRRSLYLVVYRYEAVIDEVVVIAVAHANQDAPPWH